jgi:Outer membrane protein beta-barrel domain
MKTLKLLLVFVFCQVVYVGSAQTDDQVKLDNLKYYLSVIKEYAQSMRYYTDSVKVLSLLDQMDVITVALDEELNSVILTDVSMTETMTMGDTVATMPEEKQMETLNDYSNTSVYTNPESSNENEGGGIGISKFMPFKKKFNTSLKIQFGINSLHQGNEAAPNVLSPDINTSGSWYWDFGLVRKARLGSKDSKVAINYGLSYLKNRFSIENDVRLATNTTNTPEFVLVDDLKDNPKINVGYLNVPLTLSFALSKKTKFEIGGYVGYRIHTVQKLNLKKSKESIYEHRMAGYYLNNWVYGTTAALDISGFDLIFRYNMSGLFKDNNRHDFNTWMIGTSLSLF